MLDFSTKCVGMNNSCVNSNTPMLSFSVSSDRKYGGALYGRTGSNMIDEIRLKMLSLYGFERPSVNEVRTDTFDCIVCSSGMSAIASVFYMLSSKNKELVDEVIVAKDSYFELFLFLEALKGWKVKIVDIDNVDELKKELNPSVKLVFVESCPLPFSVKHNIELICDVVHSSGYGIHVLVDNTVLTPLYCNPFELGADIVVDSLTKYLNGHGDVMGGSVVGSTFLFNSLCFNNFDRLGSRPDELSAYMINRGISTFFIRMKRITESAKVVYDFLCGYGIKTISYAGVGGVICFSFGDNKIHAQIVKSLNLIRLGYTFGTDRTLIDMCFNPDYPDDWKFYFRLSVGLENPEDLIKDLKIAFELVSSGR